METLQSLITNLCPHQWMASMDLKDAYSHIPLAKMHRQFLQFHWLSISYQFGSLPFELSTITIVFSKTLAQVVTWLRLLGVKLYLYLNDILVMDKSVLKAAQPGFRTIQNLTQAGFILNLKKSELTPTRPFVHRGKFRADNIWAGSSYQRVR